MRMSSRRRRRRVAPGERLPVGDWIRSDDAVAVLDRGDRLAVAAQLAALRLNPDSATSQDQRSVLRVHGGGDEQGPRFELGKVGFERFDADWVVELVECRDQDCVGFSVAESGAPRGRRPNADLVAELREHVGAVVEAGPPVVLRPGVPVTRDLVRVSVLPVAAFAKVRSPFSSDYLVPPPPAFEPGALVLFPHLPYDELRNLIVQLHLPILIEGEGGEEIVDLSGGRSDEVGFRLVSTSDGSGLQLRFAEESMSTIGLHRTFRAALAVLVGLARLDQAHDAVVRRALAVVDDWTEAQHADVDVDALTPTWNVRRSIDVVRLPLIADLPLAMSCTTRDVELVDTLLSAERWLTVRQRASLDDPLDRATRSAAARSAAARPFTRRPVLASKGRRGAVLTLRYGCAVTNDLTILPKVDRPDWFWGVKLRSVALAGGRRRSTLIVDGLSSSHGVLGYATELFALFHSFADLVRHRFPEVEFETLYLEAAALT